MVTLTQLEYVVAVDTYRHFAMAAETCSVTQPTLSMQIKKMEEQLGVVLFDRTKQPVVPTDVGKQILAQARIVLREWKKIDEITASFQNQIAGELRIGIIPTLAPYLLPLFIGGLVKNHPGLSVHVKELTTAQLVRQLHQDLLDVGILVTPLHDKALIERPMFYEKMYVYCHPEHPFASMPAVPAELIRRPGIWLLNDEHCFHHQVINLCTQSGTEKQPPFDYQSGSLDTLRMLVEHEGGFTLLPELAIKAMSNAKGVVKELAGVPPMREVGLVYVRHYTKERLLAMLENAIRASLPVAMLDAARGSVVEWK